MDESRPGRRRWCSMSTCGDRAKKATYRGRIDVQQFEQSGLDCYCYCYCYGSGACGGSVLVQGMRV
ncbi:CGNR zinc finger domain-containing protein [Streptomyces sp. 21So2-11]|uniref:CGNR zinc finger domain-containing protein n=1 Tax=Streptomyces sp. 21So2-11 TaxID=3144408 RepID=UPI00321BB38D